MTMGSTLNFSYAAITMQLLKHVSDGYPVLFMDVRLYHPEEDILDFCNSGNHASFYAQRSFNPEDNFTNVTPYPAMEFCFKAGGASVSFDAAPGELTFARLGLWNDKPYLAIARSEVADLPKEERRKFNRKTDLTWPHVHARLFCEHEQFINIFPCNHILTVQGDWLDTLNYLAEISGIKPTILGKEKQNQRIPVWERVGEF